MTGHVPPRILIVDDEEAILETMSFTFMDTYEVLTSKDARRALDILDERAPVAVVITDQRMPNMTGTEFLARVFERHPNTVRIMLTGFADQQATIEAINDGHIYAYISKPWEPDQLKQIVKQAVERFELSQENARLVEDLRRTNFFLEAVMDRLDTGAIAVDAADIVRAVNRSACAYLHLQDPLGASLDEIFSSKGLGPLVAAIADLAGPGRDEASFEDLDLQIGASAQRLRVNLRTLSDPAGASLGRVILIREMSHEPLRRRFDEIVVDLAQHGDDLRARIEKAIQEVGELTRSVRESGISSPSMAELSESASRTQTAMQNWLDVDDLLAREDYPDAQLLLDRMRLATQRWPREDALPERVAELERRVQAYYESGENPKERVL